MPAVLGISAFYHDAAAAIVVDGRIVAAAQEERFTRIKHDASCPRHAIEYCLHKAGLTAQTVDLVAYYEKPLLKFERLLEMQLAAAPRGLRAYLAALPVWMKDKLFHQRELRSGPLAGYRRRFVYVEHHESHAASAFLPSPFDEAAILTMDGVGEWATASLGVGRGARLQLLQELRYPHSLGLLYSAFTAFCGFRVNSGEYKLMGLAPYGQPVYAGVIRNRLMDLRDDGSFRLDLSYFNFWRGLTMTSPKFERLFGGPPRLVESPVTQRECDLAASIQLVTEEIVLRMANHLQRMTGLKNACLAGGVALNCVANGRLCREGPFDRIWIQPAAGDAGGALGAALFVSNQLLNVPRLPQPLDHQSGSLLGPDFAEDQIEHLLRQVGAVFHHFDDDNALCDRVAELLADERVVGWFQGRMEFGPRALGARSILADPQSPRLQSVMNLKIKFRESFRPFAPAVLEEAAGAYWETRPTDVGPYMMTVVTIRPEHRLPLSGLPPSGLGAVNTPRSTVPAVTHLDYSARVQTVDKTRHGRFHRLLVAFRERTGCPAVINTSFNVRGEPIVCTPGDAWRCFAATNMDALVIERFLILRPEQSQIAQHVDDDGARMFAPD